jgi:hypothetical protein
MPEGIPEDMLQGKPEPLAHAAAASPRTRALPQVVINND